MKKFWVRLGATFFFTGLFPVAPATFASFVAVAIWLALPSLFAAVTIGVIAILVVIGVWLTGEAEHSLGHDGKPIVLNEVVAPS